jgi:hypothetical protein
LNTGTPRADSSATGMLLVPAPARATAFTLAGIGLLCMSAERTSTASGSATSLAMTYSAVGRRSRPLREMLFRVWMENMERAGMGRWEIGFGKPNFAARREPVRRSGTSNAQPLRRAKSFMKSTSACTPSSGIAL